MLNPFFTASFLLFNILTIVLCKFNLSDVKFIFSEISNNFLTSAPVTPLLSLPLSGLKAHGQLTNQKKGKIKEVSQAQIQKNC